MKINWLSTGQKCNRVYSNLIKDQISSINYRLNAVENNLNQKIDRTECLKLLHHKATTEMIDMLIDDINSNKESQKVCNLQKIKYKNKKDQKDEINTKKLIQRISKYNITNKDYFEKSKQRQISDQNQLFSLIIDKIEEMQKRSQKIERIVCEKHSKVVQLNNEVYNKIISLQQQIKQIDNKYQIKQFSTHKSKQNQKQLQKQSQIILNQSHCNNDTYDGIRFEILILNLQKLQKQMAQKLNIHDLLPIVKNHLTTVSQNIKQVQNNFEQSRNNTHNILLHQSQINQQICKVLKIAYWHSYESNQQFRRWNTELYNLLPEILIFKIKSTQIIIEQKGYYLIKLYSLENMMQKWKIILGIQKYEINNQQIIKISAHTKLMIEQIQSLEVFLSIQKL